MLEELTCDGTAARACPAVVSAACLLLEIIYYELVIAFMLFYGACHVLAWWAGWIVDRSKKLKKFSRTGANPTRTRSVRK